VGIIADTHIESQYGIDKTIWKETLAWWKDQGCSLSFVTGDLGYGKTEQVRAFAAGIEEVPADPLVIAVMGNHELDGVGKRPWIDAVYPGAVPTVCWNAAAPDGTLDRLYYSFDIGSSWHVICLDANVKPPGGRTVLGMLGRQQVGWLKRDLAANEDRNVVVFVHEPIEQVGYDTPYYLLRDRAQLIETLAHHPRQKLVFSGHLHYDKVVRWRGITCVHTSASARCLLEIDGEEAVLRLHGQPEEKWTDFGRHESNRIAREGNRLVIRTRDDGGNFGRSRESKIELVEAEHGVMPTSGRSMLKFTDINWFVRRFIADQLIRIEPGMTFSYDIYLEDVVDGLDAVGVQPTWVTLDYSKPPVIKDQNGVPLSTYARTDNQHIYYEDLPKLDGRATGKWYQRQFDLSPLAGNYIDGIHLGAAATKVKVGTVYVDNIRFTWPAAMVGESPK
jgi:predicted phosphodiesterase